MSDETNDPADSPPDEPAAEAPSTPSVWGPSPPASEELAAGDTPAEPEAETSPGDDTSEPSRDAPAAEEQPDEPVADEQPDGPAEPAAETAEDEPAEEAAAPSGSEDETADASDGGAAADTAEDADGEPPSEAEASSEPPTAADAPADEDAAAQRAALEAELDRQLAALDVHVPETEAGDEDDELADEEPDQPRTAADEADTLVDQIAPVAAAEAQGETPDAVAEAPTAPLPVVEPEEEQPDELSSIAEAAVLAEAKSRGPVVPLVVVGVLIAIVIGVVIAVGSGDDDNPPAAVPLPTTPAAPGSADAPASGSSGLPMTAAEALQYFQIYGTQEPDSLTRMIQLAAPGTPARYYAVHQETLARIDPQRNAPLVVTTEGEEIKACPQDPATGGCVTYADFTKDAAGLITHFTVNGTPLRDRVAMGTGSEVTAGGMRISVITRYVSVSDRLFLAYIVHNDGTTPIAPGSVTYITPSGDTVQPDNDTFRAPVPPGGTAIAGAAFPTTQAHGTLAVTSTADGGNSQQVAQLQTP